MNDKYKDDDPFKKYDDLFDKQDNKYYPADKKKKKRAIEPEFEQLSRPKTDQKKKNGIPFIAIFLVIGIIANFNEEYFMRMTYIGWIITFFVVVSIIKAIRK